MTLSVALMGTDLIGQARTGTGKTLAFGIPVLQRTVAVHDPDYAELVAPGKPQALIVAPTRELALQVSGDLALAGADRGTRVLTVYGGVSYEPQLEALDSGVDVVVGTPGRLLDLANRRALDLSHVKSLVLDEADEMLDLGFLPDVERIIAKTPETRQTMLFSATMPGAIVSLARMHMRHPMNIRAESSEAQQTVPATAQFIYQVHDLDKPEMLARILQAENSGLTIVFTRTKRAAQRVADDMAERGFDALPLHGDMQQVSREKALKKFREGKTKLLVATDVAARGIDVSNVTHVINYSCPEDDKTYVHRIGRTGRAGATGIAITFVDWADVTRWKIINKTLDLPFDDPAETYSNSEHFLHDQGIPPGTKGRIVPEKPREEKQSDDKARGERSERSDRPRRNRSRSRTRGGEPVDGSAAAGNGDKPAGGQRGQSDQSGEGGEGSGRSRNRRRRRRPGSGSSSASSAATQPATTAGE
ncbi:DEAD/DEAH box helicase [Nocardioides iriomotensis]|uniref:RNA helicase n=2 Tax=Nocardioides iriomotensis TaxID=715784 RepID=A0A4Q5J6U8_9ACTN|nr:DEAD/DEAH box helicase [Nocardioides iriomotensis]